MKTENVQRKLNRGARLFVQLQVIFTGVTAILTLFINTFLLNAFGSFSKEVLLYNATMALVQPLAMVTAMKITEKANALIVQRIGMVFYCLALVVLCVFGEMVSGFYPLFAVLLSFGAGYYYSTYSTQVLCYADDSNRDKVSGLVVFFSSIISIFLPLLMGFLISKLGTTNGYRVVFGIAAILAIGAFFTTKLLPELPKHERKPVLGMVCKTILADPNGRRIMVANGLCNLRTFTIPIFVTLLFYNLAPNEFLISLNTTVGSVVALVGSFVYVNVVKPKNRVKSAAIAAVIVIASTLGMLFKMNIYMVMLFNAVLGFFNATFMSGPVLNTHFSVVEKLGLRGEYGAEVHFMREIFVSAGRILGLLLIWLMPQTNAGAVLALVCMVLTSAANAAILRKIEHS